MNNCLCLLAFIFSPAILFSQINSDSSTVYSSAPAHILRIKGDSAFSILFNTSTAFYTSKDSRINNFLDKYGYMAPQNIPVGIRFELAVVPSQSKMMYSINAATIVSKQDIVTADFSLGAYHRFFETKNFRVLAGMALGAHYDRIVLSGNLPPSFDSLAQQYDRTLSLHRAGLIVEPAAKIFWYPLQTKNFQLGLFAGIGYDVDFNSRWKLGYYNQNGSFTTFKKIKKPTNVRTKYEYGWVLSAGLSACFKFD
jgi:hypothetical protein